MVAYRPSWFTDTITVIRPATRVDRYGDTVEDWDDPVETEVGGCKVNPLAGTEDTGRLDDRAALSRRWSVNAPPDADIHAHDRVRFDDTEYQVDGDVSRWRSPTGMVSHLYFELIRWEG